MKFETIKKEKSNFIAPGVLEREGNYIICPECGHDRCYRLTEEKPETQIEWRCRKCKKYLGGIIQEDGTVKRISVAPARKWILVEIDADSDPVHLTAFRPQSREEAARRTLPSEEINQYSVPITFSLRLCKTDADVNPQGFPQYKGQ
jgi:ribosomal protein L37AE/L43A